MEFIPRKHWGPRTGGVDFTLLIIFCVFVSAFETVTEDYTNKLTRLKF